MINCRWLFRIFYKRHTVGFTHAIACVGGGILYCIYIDNLCSAMRQTAASQPHAAAAAQPPQYMTLKPDHHTLNQNKTQSMANTGLGIAVRPLSTLLIILHRYVLNSCRPNPVVQHFQIFMHTSVCTHISSIPKKGNLDPCLIVYLSLSPLKF